MAEEILEKFPQEFQLLYGIYRSEILLGRFYAEEASVPHLGEENEMADYARRVFGIHTPMATRKIKENLGNSLKAKFNKSVIDTLGREHYAKDAEQYKDILGKYVEGYLANLDASFNDHLSEEKDEDLLNASKFDYNFVLNSLMLRGLNLKVKAACFTPDNEQELQARVFQTGGDLREQLVESTLAGDDSRVTSVRTAMLSLLDQDIDNMQQDPNNIGELDENKIRSAASSYIDVEDQIDVWQKHGQLSVDEWMGLHCLFHTQLLEEAVKYVEGNERENPQPKLSIKMY